MRAVGYFRYGDEEGSFKALEAAFYEYCDLNLHQPIKVFGDLRSGGDGSYPELRRTVEFIRESGGGFLVVVPNAGHLGGDLESVARVVVELEGAGTRVLCAQEELPDPLQNALDTLGVRGVSRDRSRRIRESMRARALDGQGLGRPPYGYRNGQDGALEVVKEEAAVVELTYRLYTKDGLGLRLIAQHLNERNIPTRRSGRWNMVSIREILRNPTYMGTYTRFGFRVPKSHQAIVPSDTFRTAQDLTRNRRPVGRVVNAEPFLLSGLVYCHYCGNKMMGVTRRQSWRRKDGRRSRAVYRYYQCQSRNNQSFCGYHTWRAPILEGAVLGQLRHALRVGAEGSEGGADLPRRQDVQAMWDAQVRNAERRLLKAVRRAARGEFSIGALGEYLSQLDEARARRGASGQMSASDVAETLVRWESLPMAGRRSFLMEHVVRIDVRDEVVEVVV